MCQKAAAGFEAVEFITIGVCQDRRKLPDLVERCVCALGCGYVEDTVYMRSVPGFRPLGNPTFQLEDFNSCVILASPQLKSRQKGRCCGPLRGQMQAFEFDHHLIDSYERFSRSFSSIRSEDLRTTIDAEYDEGRFWPDALLSPNPRYLSGPTVDELVASDDLDEACGKVFRFGETPLRFHRHQAESIAKAISGQSYVVTTGTGSGKSLCFFFPIVDAVIRALSAGKSSSPVSPSGCTSS